MWREKKEPESTLHLNLRSLLFGVYTIDERVDESTCLTQRSMHSPADKLAAPRGVVEEETPSISVKESLMREF